VPGQPGDRPRRAFEEANDDDRTAWINQQMDRTFAPLLEQEWVLDPDATSKTRYGHQARPTFPRLSDHGAGRGQTRPLR
jgi:hypothetical protein